MAATSTRDNSPELSPGQQDRGYLSRELFRKRTGLGLGIILSLLVYFFMPAELDHNLRATAGVAVLMAVWWMSEAIPIAVTALLPLALFPILNLAEIKDFSGKYTDPTIFLFMGGFLLALAMQRWNLHKRVALWVLVLMGSSPKMLILGFMVATGFLSMWVSNTATAVMMLPIGVSVLSLIVRMLNDEKVAAEDAESASESVAETSGGDALEEAEESSSSYDPMPKSNFGIALMLGIAYAASIGSFKPEIEHIPGGRELMRDELKRLGRMSAGERRVLMVFIAAALAWVFVPVLAPDTKIADAVIAMTVGIALFLIPGGPDGVKLMRWENALELPWGVLLLFGGGLALSSQFGASGLSDWIGEQLSTLGWMPVAALVVVVGAVVLFLTEFTSNTATAATFLPLVGAMAIGLGHDQMIFAVPVALAATSAFMMPVATPPNAIAYGSGYVSMDNMVKAGVWLNIIALIVISVASLTLLQWVFGVVY